MWDYLLILKRTAHLDAETSVMITLSCPRQSDGLVTNDVIYDDIYRDNKLKQVQIKNIYCKAFKQKKLLINGK